MFESYRRGPTVPQLISMERIWDHAPHNAFTDLIRFRGRWWCVFREAQAHDAPGGIVRVLKSETGGSWESAATVEERGIDLRDPKLSVTPDGRLMLLMGGCVYDDEGEYLTRAPRVSFSEDGSTWSDPQKVLSEDHWLWRATWHGDRAYALSKLGEGKGPRRGFLYTSMDGIDWDWITEFKLPGVSETTLGFQPDGEMIALIRPRLHRREQAALSRMVVLRDSGAHRWAELHPAPGRQSVGERQTSHRRRSAHGLGTHDDLIVRTGAHTPKRRGHQLRGDGLARGPSVDELLLVARRRHERLPGEGGFLVSRS